MHIPRSEVIEMLYRGGDTKVFLHLQKINPHKPWTQLRVSIVSIDKEPKVPTLMIEESPGKNLVLFNTIFRLCDQLLRCRRGRWKWILTVLCCRWNDGSTNVRGRCIRNLHGVHGSQHQHHRQQVHHMRAVCRWQRLPMGCSRWGLNSHEFPKPS